MFVKIEYIRYNIFDQTERCLGIAYKMISNIMKKKTSTIQVGFTINCCK